MKLFAELITQLDQSNKTTDKVNALKQYFSKAEDKDKVWALALFTGRRPRRKVNSTLLKQWTSEWAQIPYWLFEESYQTVGDLAETIALLLPTSEQTQSDQSLTNWINFLVTIGPLSNEQKEEQLKKAYSQLSQQERFVFTKLMTGGWRLGVSQNLFTRAIAEVTEIDKAVIAHRIMGNWYPSEISFQELIVTTNENDLASRPYPFFLAYPIENNDVESLGKPEEWLAEWKWDGIRGQIARRNNETFIWSRGEELVTEKYPELVDMAQSLPDGTVLDGEILPFKDGAPLPFAALQKRIGRKKAGKKLLKEAPVIFKVYDILESNYNDIRKQSLEERKKRLQKLSENIKHDAFELSTAVRFNSWKELSELKKEARKNKAEGFMLKAQNSPYEVGRKKGSWWKWKVAPLTIDGVLIYAQKGHGRRANLYTDYTFAVWNKEELIPFAKAYSGLTDKEINKVDSFVKRHTKEKFGPVRTVEPQLVFEIAFEGIQTSKRHKSGIAVRFPRINRWRQDKPKEEANTLEDLQYMLEVYE